MGVVYFLRPFEREVLAKTEPEIVADDATPSPLQKQSGKKRYVRNPLPCGRNSPWKRQMNGKVVRRKEGATYEPSN